MYWWFSTHCNTGPNLVIHNNNTQNSTNKKASLSLKGTDTVSTIKDLFTIESKCDPGGNWAVVRTDISARTGDVVVPHITLGGVYAVSAGIPYVGIGNTGPSVRLDVAGEINTNKSYMASGVTGISGANISPYAFTVAGGIITGHTGTAGLVGETGVAGIQGIS